MKNTVLLCVAFFGSALFAATNSLDLDCVASNGQVELIRKHDLSPIGQFQSLTDCQASRAAAAGGVVCVWFKPGMKVGPGSWIETGWRPMNIETEMGLGRRTILKQADCLELTRNANGQIVCTQTGLGYKPTHIETGTWCGFSSQMRYCIQASIAAHNGYACSFPSLGTGAEAGWSMTQFSDRCKYIGRNTTLADCNTQIP